MAQTVLVKDVVQNLILSTAVKMSLVETPGRDEASLLTIGRRLGELGEVKLMTDLWAHVERFQQGLDLLADGRAPSRPQPPING